MKRPSLKMIFVVINTRKSSIDKYLWIHLLYFPFFKKGNTCLVDAPGLLHYFQLLFPSMSHRKGLAPSQQLFHSKPSFSSDFIASSFCIIISFCIHLYKAHILIKVDIFCSKSVNELLMVRLKIGKDDGDDEEEE